MARLNEILVGRFNRGLQRVFGIKGPPPVATLAPEIMPVHVVPNGVETRYLETWNRYGFSVVYGPTAANQNTARFLNPTNTNVLAVVEKLLVCTTVPNNIQITIANNLPNLSALDSGVTLDFRNTATPVCIPSHVNASAAVGTAIANIELFAAAGGTYECIVNENQEIVLTPGVSLSFQQSNVNTAYTVTMWWRERLLEDSEKI